MKKLFCCLFLFSLSAVAAAQDAPAYVLQNTEVHELGAKELKRDYQVFVSLPPSYKNSARRYPVVFVTDANYAFPLIRSIAQRLGYGEQGLEEFILVGLSYAKGDTTGYSRRRDYTPGPSTEKNIESDMPGRAPAFGQAEGYRKHIETEVFPLIARTYRADMTRKIFAGHSYGSLLGLHTLFTQPGMFDQYILGSPSLWFGGRAMLAQEKAYAASHKDLKAKVYFAVGGLEVPRPGDTINMVADLKEFERTLKGRRYPGLQIKSRVMDDEDHLTVAPRIITGGLKWLLPPIKP